VITYAKALYSNDEPMQDSLFAKRGQFLFVVARWARELADRTQSVEGHYAVATRLQKQKAITANRAIKILKQACDSTTFPLNEIGLQLWGGAAD
jgi:hypothetical protein